MEESGLTAAKKRTSEHGGPHLAPHELRLLASELDAYHPFHVVHADLLRRSSRTDLARHAYDCAFGLTPNNGLALQLTHDSAVGRNLSPRSGPVWIVPE